MLVLPGRVPESIKNIQSCDKNGRPLPNRMQLSVPQPEASVGHARPSILLVGNDGLAYLIERYADRSGMAIHAATVNVRPGEIAGLRPSVVWVASLGSLERLRPRETRLIHDDCPIVVSISEADDGSARDLGADYCALQPLTYSDFLTALAAVGVATPAGSRHAAGSVALGAGANPPLAIDRQ